MTNSKLRHVRTIFDTELRPQIAKLRFIEQLIPAAEEKTRDVALAGLKNILLDVIGAYEAVCQKVEISIKEDGEQEAEDGLVLSPESVERFPLLRNIVTVAETGDELVLKMVVEQFLESLGKEKVPEPKWRSVTDVIRKQS